jgi:hypothetical protein
VEFPGPGHSTTGVETCQTLLTRLKILLSPAPQKFNTFNTFKLFSPFALFATFASSHHASWRALPPFVVVGNWCERAMPWPRLHPKAVRYDAGVADASAAGITPSWVRTVAKSQYSLSRWISPSSASSRIEATRTLTCCPVPGGSGPNCPL